MNTPPTSQKNSWPHPALIVGIVSAFLAAWLWDASVASTPPKSNMILGAATVTDAQCKENTRTDGGNSGGKTVTYFLPAITYNYSAAGKSYEGHGYMTDSVILSMNREQCERLIVELKVSNSKTVWYAPDDPADAVLNPNTPQPPPAIIIFTVLASVLVVLGIWLQLRWQRQAKPD